MLTVKHISLGNEEHIYEARTVVYRPADVRSATTEPSPQADALEVYLTSGAPEVLFGGTAFVMNESGKTVSRYDLGASNVGLFDPSLSSEAIKRGVTGDPKVSLY